MTSALADDWRDVPPPVVSHKAEGGVRMLAGVLPHLLREPAAGGRDFRECFHLEAML